MNDGEVSRATSGHNHKINETTGEGRYCQVNKILKMEVGCHVERMSENRTEKRVMNSN